jgi:uracil-DNA glycosylase family 4
MDARSEAARLARAARQTAESLERCGVRQHARRPAAARAAVARAPDAAAPGEERRTGLAEMARRVAACTRCGELARTRTQTVFGVGNPSPALCFVGEAPGAEEDARGEPFVGAAGKLLDRVIAAMGLRRQDVYICNVLKCRPPGNRQPLPDEVTNCAEYLDFQIDLLQPKYICALGAVAARRLLDTPLSMGRLRGKFHDYRGIPLLCTYHPAYLLRNPAAKKDVWEDMQILMRELGLKTCERGA